MFNYQSCYLLLLSVLFLKMMPVQAETVHSLAEIIPQGSLAFAIDDCKDDAEVIPFWWKLSWAEEQNLPLSWAAYLYLDSGACPVIYTVDPVYKMLDFGSRIEVFKSSPYIPRDENEREFNARTLVGEEICTSHMQNYRLCLYTTEIDPLTDGSVPAVPQAAVNLLSDLLIAVDTIAPEKPELDFPVTTNEAIEVVLKNVDDESYTYQIQYRSCEQVDSDAGSDETDENDENDEIEELTSLCDSSEDLASMTVLTQSSLKISSLNNELDYEYRVALIDDFGNIGTYSELQRASPDSGFTPTDLYVGGENPLTFEGPSCHHSSLQKLFVFQLVAIFLLLLRFRKRKIASKKIKS